MVLYKCMINKTLRGQSSVGAIIAVCVVIILGFAVFALISRQPDQTESDCSKVEVFDTSAKRCKVITGLEYAKKWAASDEANIKYGREKLTVCTPANEINRTLVGKYILACYKVAHIYDTGKGTVFLDSGTKRGDFSAVSFRYNPLRYSDAEGYLGKFIGIYGTVTDYEGQLEIIINSRDQIIMNPYDYYEGYSKEELANRRSSCFESKIQDAKTKEAKDRLMSECRILSLKRLTEDMEDYGY